MEWKISVMRRRPSAGRSSRRLPRRSGATALKRSMPLVLHALQPLGGEVGRVGAGILLRHRAQRLPRGLPLLQLVLAITHLEQGVPGFVRLRVVLDGLLEAR